MAGGDKKEMKAQLKVLPWVEMKKHQKAWFQENFGKNRKVQEWSYEKKAKLDPREWDANKLQKALTGLVRYEAVLFASRTEEWIKKIDKSKDKDKTLKEAQQKLPGYFSEIHKKMTLKVDKAIDELGSDKGGSKKAIEAGNEIFAKVKELKSEEIFGDTAADVKSAMAVFKKEMTKAIKMKDTDKTKAEESAMSSAASSIKSAHGSLRTLVKTKGAVVKDFNTKAAKMSKDKKADPALMHMGLQLTRLKTASKAVVGDMTQYLGELDKLHKAFFDETMNLDEAYKWENKHGDPVNAYSSPKKFLDQIKTHKNTFVKKVDEIKKNK